MSVPPIKGRPVAQAKAATEVPVAPMMIPTAATLTPVSEPGSPPPLSSKGVVDALPIEDRPAVSLEMPAKEERAEPSPPFRSWVNTLKITGVRAGTEPRMMIGGMTYDLGDIVNHELGATFDSYDADRHLVRFREKSGATLERRDR